MFDNPLFLPVTLTVIVLGIFYLIVSGRGAEARHEKETESQQAVWQVQCPKCNRWQKSSPISRKDVPDNPQAMFVWPDARQRYWHTHKCKFCGHRWQEQHTT